MACAVPQGGQKERRLQVYVGLLDLCYYFHEFGYYFEFNLTLLLILSLFFKHGSVYTVSEMTLNHFLQGFDDHHTH